MSKITPLLVSGRVRTGIQTFQFQVECTSSVQICSPWGQRGSMWQGKSCQGDVDSERKSGGKTTLANFTALPRTKPESGGSHHSRTEISIGCLGSHLQSSHALSTFPCLCPLVPAFSASGFLPTYPIMMLPTSFLKREFSPVPASPVLNSHTLLNKQHS